MWVTTPAPSRYALPVTFPDSESRNWRYTKPAQNQFNFEFVVVDSMDTPRSYGSSLKDLEKSSSKTWTPGREEWLIMATLAVSSLIVALDSTILVPVLPTLAADLKGTAQETFWAGTSYLLANAVVQPSIASISDIFGRKELLIPSIVLFTVGSIVCGVAKDFTSLLAGRVVQGIGGGGIITMAQLIFADIVPLRQRPKYFSVVLLAWALGTVIGPLLGGALVEKSTWRWCFYLNFPICGVAFVMAFFCVNLASAKTSFIEKLKNIDWVGNFLLVASLTSFLIATSWGGVEYVWSSWRTLVPLVAGVMGLLATIGWERFFAIKPFLTRALFHQSSSIFSYLCAMLQGLAIFMVLYYFPFYTMSVLGKSALASGVMILPASLCLLPGSAISSALITRLGAYRWAIWTGWVIATIGAGLFMLMGSSPPAHIWATVLSIFGLGMGLVLSSVNFSVQAVVDPSDAGRAAGMYAFMRAIGMCLGVAVGGTVFQNRMQDKLAQLGLPLDLAREAEAFISQLRMLEGDDPVKRAIIEAYTQGFDGAWQVLVGICGIGLLLSLGIKHFNMDRMLESKFRVQSR